MSSSRLPSFARLASPLLVLVLALAAAAAGCGASSAPQLKVLGVERAHRADSMVLLVEVVNHAPRPMRLERLQYSFGPARSVTPEATAPTGSQGDVPLDRTVEAGAAVVVQVPLDLAGQAVTPGQILFLSGQLVTHENQIERRFPVNASLAAPDAPTP
jgi:hypothetical protein